MGVPSSRESDPGVDSLTYREHLKRKNHDDAPVAGDDGIPLSLHKDPYAADDLVELLKLRAYLADNEPENQINLKTISLVLSHAREPELVVDNNEDWVARGISIGTTDASTLADRNSAAWITPPWAPSFFWSKVFENGLLTIEVISAMPGYRNVGMGRAVVNALQQGLASTPEGIQIMRASSCYFPTFYTVDSHYNWMMDCFNIAGLDEMPPPRQIFPMHLSYRDSKTGIPVDSKRLDEQIAENKEAIYEMADLYWSTPFAWHERRIHHLLGRTHSLLLEVGYDWVDYASTGNFLNVKSAFRTQRIKLDQPEPSPAGVSIAWQLAVFESVVPSNRKDLIVKLGEGLRVLGNVDYLKIGGGVFDHDVLAIFFPLSSIQPVDAASSADTKTLFILFLAFLIDHCRVFFQPIVLDYVLVERMFGSLDGFNNALSAKDFVTRPCPYFVKLEHEPPLRPLLLWIPVKKPHSTSNYEGRDILDMPEWEEEPMFSKLSREPPSKRRRLTHFCTECGLSAKHHDSMHAFCSIKCQTTHYYL